MPGCGESHEASIRTLTLSCPGHFAPVGSPSRWGPMGHIEPGFLHYLLQPLGEEGETSTTVSSLLCPDFSSFLFSCGCHGGMGAVGGEYSLHLLEEIIAQYSQWPNILEGQFLLNVLLH